MKKIPSLFARDGANLTKIYNAGTDWVVNGEGVATRKWDGTACRWADGQLWARYDAKQGKPTPPGFVPCQDPDPITGHHPGWVPATRPEDKWIRAACDVYQVFGHITDGTFEACGPKIGGNAERFEHHVLVRHGAVVNDDVPLTFDGLVGYFTAYNIEGIVWWRDLTDLNCDKIKITGAALGVPRRKP